MRRRSRQSRQRRRERLRTAYTGGSRDARIGAMRGFVGSDSEGLAGYGRLILTARAAQRIPVAGKTDGSDPAGPPRWLTPGSIGPATRWRGAVSRGSLGWALILVSDPDSNARYGSGEVGAFSGDADKQRMFAAGLAGLARLDPAVAQSYGADVQGDNGGTRAIDRAAAEAAGAKCWC